MRTLSIILAIGLAFSHIPDARGELHPEPVTLETLMALFPDARLVGVSPAEYEHLVAQANGRAVILVADRKDVTNEGAQDEATDAAVEHRPPPPAGTMVPARVRTSQRTQVAVFAEGTGSIATDDAAVILYVLVGVFVIGAALIYGGVILYEIIAGHREYEYWQDVSVSGWRFGGSGRQGGMYGVRGALGLLGEFNRVGLILESGYLDGRFRLRDDEGTMNVHGIYGLLGPSIQWPLTRSVNPVSWDFEVLTGYSSADRVGLMSRALTGFSWGMGSQWRVGVMVGSTYAKIRETEGPLNTKSDFNLTVGGWLGARF